MKKTIYALILLLVISANWARAENTELAPGYDACMDKAQSTADYIDCANNAYEHWDKILNARFAQAKQFCANSEKPKECAANLLKAQKLWIQYKEAMYPVIGELNGGGSMSRLEENIFAVKETKKQAELLQINE